jgi:hypothetical protein
MNKKGIDWISDIAGFDIYEELEIKDRMSFKPGQLYSAPIKYPLTPPKVLQLESYNPEREESTTFGISNYDPSNPLQEMPLKFLNLKSDDRLFILQGKKRPVIVLTCCDVDWLYNTSFKSGIKEQMVLCLPVFTFKDRHTQEYIVKIQAFIFPNLFYLSPSSQGIFHESAARFELIQPIHKGDMQPLKNVNNKPFRLSDNTLKLLYNQLSIFLSISPLDESLQQNLMAYQQLVFEEFDWSN